MSRVTCFRRGKAASYREMHLLKATLVTLVSVALSVPSVAQAAGASSSVPPNKTAAVTGKVATTTTSQTPTKVAPAVQGPQTGRAKAKKAAGKKAPEPQPRVQLPPPPPPTPAQLPPNPARVTMRNGLLTIDANNSTLADVLTGVRRETKAAIDLPAGASGERVVANLGPGTPQNVLTALLNGSRFDYIILGSQDQPDTVQRVILRAKSGPEPAPVGRPVVAQRAPNQVGVNVQPAQPDEGDEQGAPAEEIPDENNQQPQQQEIDGEQQQGQPNQQQQQPGVKTPEQLLEELRQMQQQQQENQQQQQQQQGPQPLYQQQQPQQPSPDEQ